jgi:hypothetical protein
VARLEYSDKVNSEDVIVYLKCIDKAIGILNLLAISLCLSFGDIGLSIIHIACSRFRTS